MNVSLRAAVAADAPLLSEWDVDPDVVASHQDDTASYISFSREDWESLLETGEPGNTYLVAQADRAPIGVVQIVDPDREPDSDWGDTFPPRMRALHIWIGSPDWRGRGLGTQVMVEALDHVFADPGVDGVLIDPLASNTAAHRFYRRLGFRDLEHRTHGTSKCLIMLLNRTDWLAGDSK